jgi:hypothetical protein
VAISCRSIFSNHAFFRPVQQGIRREKIIAMMFNPLISIIMATDKNDKEMTIVSDRHQSIAAAEIIFDAIFQPLFTFSRPLAENHFRLTTILPDILDNGLCLPGSGLGLFAGSP